MLKSKKKTRPFKIILKLRRDALKYYNGSENSSKLKTLKGF
jgi:hypothetical protein